MHSRRAFLGIATAAFAGLLAACRLGAAVTPTLTAPPVEAEPNPTASPAPTPTATPEPSSTPTPTEPPPEVVAWLDPDASASLRTAGEHLLETLRAAGAAAGFTLRITEDAAAADVRLTTRPSGQGSTRRGSIVATEPLVLVTSPRVPVDGVSREQAQALLTGTVADWADVGALVSVPVVPSEPGIAADDLAARFEEQPGTVALLPLATLDYRFQAVAIDGLDLVRHPHQAGAAPFSRDLHCEVPGDLPLAAVRTLDNAGVARVVGVPDDAVTVTMCGDIILGRTVHTIMNRLGDFTAPFHLVADELRAADLTIGNLECSLSDTIEPPDDPYTFSFMTFTDAVAGLELAGIDGVSQANNHSMNFGAQGMRDTLAALETAGIKHFGIGEDLTAARAPAIFEVHGLRIAFLGYDGITGDIAGAGDTWPGTAPLDVEYMVEDITAAAAQADIVIPFVHWGIEYELVPRDYQREISYRAIEAGATLVVGSHPHWVQGMEIYQGRPIVYSLGNFVFDQEWSLETKQGLIMHLVFHGPKLAGLRFVPVLIEDYYRPRIVAGDERVAILDRVWASTDELASVPVG